MAAVTPTATGTVVGIQENAQSRALSVKAGDGFTYTRSFAVRVSHPNTPLITIINAIGVGLWASHPEDSFSKAQSFDVKPRGGSSLTYDIVVQYQKVPIKDENRNEQKPGDPPSATRPATVWSGGTSLSEVPFEKDKDGNLVANSAKVPFPDVTKQEPRPTLTCVKAFADYAKYKTAAKAVVGKTNSSGWGGEAANAWLCSSSRWAWKSENQGNVAFRYVEATFEFEYDEDQHRGKYIDRGYQKRGADGKLEPILGEDGKPIKEPVALDGSGQPMDPPPDAGTPPKIVNGGNGFKKYDAVEFTSHVGNPA